MGQAIYIPITVHSKPSEPALLPVKHSGGFAYEKDRNATPRNALPGSAKVKTDVRTVKEVGYIEGLVEFLTTERNKKEQQRTRKLKKEFLFYYAQCRYVVTVASQKTGINRTTFYRWCESDPVFAEAVEKLQRYVNDEMLDALRYKALIEMHGPSIIAYLNRFHPEFIRHRNGCQAACQEIIDIASKCQLMHR